jgi:hypothetical protein
MSRCRGDRQGRPRTAHRRAEFGLLDDRSYPTGGGGANSRAARHPAWGPELPGAGRGVAVDGGIRHRRWGFAIGTARHWLGAHVPVFEPDGTPRPTPTAARSAPSSSEDQRRDHRQLARIGLSTGSDSYRLTTLRPAEIHRPRDNEAERREPGCSTASPAA